MFPGGGDPFLGDLVFNGHPVGQGMKKETQVTRLRFHPDRLAAVPADHGLDDLFH
jgi:hypothetical protein